MKISKFIGFSALVPTHSSIFSILDVVKTAVTKLNSTPLRVIESHIGFFIKKKNQYVYIVNDENASIVAACSKYFNFLM